MKRSITRIHNGPVPVSKIKKKRQRGIFMGNMSGLTLQLRRQQKTISVAHCDKLKAALDMIGLKLIKIQQLSTELDALLGSIQSYAQFIQHEAVHKDREAVYMIRMNMCNQDRGHPAGIQTHTFEFLKNTPRTVDQEKICTIVNRKSGIVPVLGRYRASRSQKSNIDLFFHGWTPIKTQFI